MNIEPLDQRMEAFGWTVEDIDGHDINELERAVSVPHKDKPLMVICRTNPAQGISLLDSMIPKHFISIPADRHDEFELFCQNM